MLFRQGVLGCCALAVGAALAAQGPPSFDDCERQLASVAGARKAAFCLYTAASAAHRMGEGEERLRALSLRFPNEPRIPFYLGLLSWSDSARAERWMAASASGFAAQAQPEEEVNALANRFRLLCSLGRAPEAAADVRRVVALTPRLRKQQVQALALLMRARFLIAGTHDFGAALQLLDLAREKIFPFGPNALKKQYLADLGDTTLALGHFDAARDAFRKLTRLARSEGGADSALAEAQGLYGELRVLRDQSIDELRPGARQEAHELAEQTLGAALRAGSRDVEAKARVFLGLLGEGPAARQHLDRCIAIAEAVADRSACLSALARILGPSEPERSRRIVDLALEQARRAGSAVASSYALREQVRLAWRLASPEAAWAAARADLAILEALRDLEPGQRTQAETFSTLSPHFYLLSGQLLRDYAEEGRSESLDRAFEVIERFRARSLTDRLEQMRSLPLASAETRKIDGERGEILRQISDLQRGLLRSNLAPSTRRRDLAALARLEGSERELEERMARADPRFADLRRGFASPSEVRQALGPDEALLSFQIGPWEDMQGDFAGGAWLLVATRGEVRVLPLRAELASRAALRDGVRFFSGLVERHDGTEVAAARALYRALLADGIASLEPEIRKLVLVPDDALHLLPFGALRGTPEELPLAARYELVVVPSATLWLRWRQGRPIEGSAPALVYADPKPPGGTGTGAANGRAAIFAETFQLGSLPGARREGRDAVDRLGAGSELYVGSEASEASLKARLARPFGLLHLAAHAVVDEAVPERSGILLAPGAAGEDGLLQVREIVGLKLDGKVVVLSACRTAGGSVVRGEGVMGLARAFFQAGAHTVVASLWPLGDEAGAALFAAFYRELARGLSVAEALRRAQGARIAEGAPAFDWAGVVVLGDGNLVPVPGGARSARRPSAWAGGVALLLVTAGAWVFWRSRLRRIASAS